VIERFQSGNYYPEGKLLPLGGTCYPPRAYPRPRPWLGLG